MNPISAFRNMQEELGRTYALPLPVKVCVKALSGIHWIWWICRKKEMVNPENIVPAALGSVLEGGLRFAPNVVEQAVRGIAKLILIATRIDESFQSMRSLGDAFLELKNAFRGKFSLVLEPDWIKKPKAFLISTYSINQLNTLTKRLFSSARRIYQCVLNIFVKIFKLSMHLWDTYHAFVFSHDAIPELFVNGMHWFRKIRNNKDYINTKLEEYRVLMQNLFEATQTSISADKLIDRTKNFLNYTVKGIETADAIHTFVGNQVLNPIKKVIHLVKSKLLGRDLKKQRAHTPFVLKSLPNISWEGSQSVNFKKDNLKMI